MRKILNRRLVWLCLCGLVVTHAQAMTSLSTTSMTVKISTKQREFIIPLAANPTTGYAWKLTRYDSRFIKWIGQTYIPNKRQGLIGAGGVMQWYFTIADHKPIPSKLLIEFTYARAWDVNHPGKITEVVVLRE